MASGGSWSGGNGTFSPGSNVLNPTYTPSQGEIANGFVTLTLTTTGNGNCLAVTDEVTISFSDAPTADAGPNQTVCANNPDVQLAGEVTIATGGVWSGGEGSFSPNANDLNAVYTPSADEIAAGSVQLTLTTTGNGDCLPVTDVMTINITPTPVVNAGSDLFSCANSPTVTLSGSVTVASGGIWSGGNGQFTPSNTSLTATYTPSEAEIAAGFVTLTLTSTGNGLCNEETDEMTIFIAPAPVVDAGAPVIVCANNNEVQLNGSITNAGGGVWSGGLGTFIPSAADLNAVYIPSAAEIATGGLTLTLTSTDNGTCLPESATLEITITPAPTVDAGADLTVCADDADVSLNGVITVAGGGIWSGGSGTFDPSPTDLNAIYTPSFVEISAGTVTLTLTSTDNGDCLPVSDQITITVQPVPFVNAGPDINVCANNAQVQLGGIFFNAESAVWSGGLGTFLPNNTDINAVYIPTQAEILTGTVNLTLTTVGTAFCEPRSDDVTITIAPAPVVDAGLDLVQCANNPNAQLTGSVLNAGGGIWSGGTGSFLPGPGALNAVYVPSPADISAGSVTLTLTSTGNGNCLAVTDEVTIFYSPAPIVDAGSTAVSCGNNPEVQLNGNVIGAGGGIWSGGNGSFVPNNTVLDATYIPTEAEIAAGLVVLTLTSTDNGDCLAETDEVVVTIETTPVVNAGADVLACLNDTEIQLNGLVTGATTTGTWSTSGTGAFSPSPDDLNAVYLVSEADIDAGGVLITLTSTNNGTCLPVTDELTITILPPGIADAGPDVTVCANNPAVFLNGNIDGEATAAIWTTSGDGIFTPNASTLNATYLPGPNDIAGGGATLTLTANSCDAASDDLVLTITPAPLVVAGSNVTICVDNLSVPLNGSVSGATNTGVWSTSGTGTFVPDNTTLNATYIPSSADSASQSVVLTLTATNIGDCLPVSGEITVSIFPPGVANAGPDETICSNQEAVQLNGIISGQASEGVWTTTGDGAFIPDATTLNASYVPGPNDISSGGTNLVLTATNSCNFTSDFLTLSIIPGPMADAGMDMAVCDGTLEFDLNGSISNAGGGIWSTSGTGTFADATSPVTTYFASEADLESGLITLTLTTTDNGICEADSDQITIIVTEGILADAGSDQEVCELAGQTQLQGVVSAGSVTGIWSTAGDGTFEPDPTDLNAQYVFGPGDLAAGSVTLTLTSTNNGVCDPAVDEMVITFGDAPFVDAGFDGEVCADNTEFALNGFITGGASSGVWSTSGSGMFEPSADQLNAVYIASEADAAAGSVVLTLTTTDHDLCEPGSASVVLTILPIPVVDAGPDQIICDPSEQIVLNGSVLNAAGGIWSTNGTGSILPDNTALSALYLPSAADSALGVITFTLTSTGNGLCEAVSDEMTIQIGVELIANAGEDVVVCASEPEVTLEGIVGGDATGGTWSTSGDGTFSPNANDLNAVYTPGENDITAGTVTIILTTVDDTGCPPATDQLTITIDPVPLVDAGADVDVCGDLGGIELNPSTTFVSALSWSTSGSGTFSPDANTANATYLPSAADSLTGSVTLTLTSNNEGACEEANDALTITFHPEPMADAGEDMLQCNNDLSIVLNGSVSGAEGGVWSTSGTGSFEPDPNALNAVYVASALDSIIGSVELTLTTISSSPCDESSATILITFEAAPVAIAGDDLVTCGTINEIQLNGIVSNTAGATWSSSGTGAFTPNENTLDAVYTMSAEDIEEGSVVLTLTTEAGEVCEPASDQLNIIIDNPLIANFDVANACVGQTTQFIDQTLALGGEIVSWMWDFGNGQTSSDQNPSVVYSETGSYTVTLMVVDAQGCVAEVTQLVSISEVPTAAFSVETVDEDGTFSFTDNSDGASSWSWDFGDGVGSSNVQNPVYRYPEDGLFTVILTVTNEFGCSDSTSAVVEWEGTRILPPKMPNAFSPNGDGLNDVYNILGGPFSELDFKVYNGWGELIFESNQQENGWDGTHRGQDVPVGVYVYTVKATTIEGTEHEKSGQISLIR